MGVWQIGSVGSGTELEEGEAGLGVGLGRPPPLSPQHHPVPRFWLCAVWWWQVYQEYMVVPSLSLVPALARVLTHCAASDPAYKVIVFFPTARFTGCVCTRVVHVLCGHGVRLCAAECALPAGARVWEWASDVRRRSPLALGSLPPPSLGAVFSLLPHTHTLPLPRTRTSYMAGVMGDAGGGGMGLNVLEIHSRKSQSARVKVRW